MSAVLEINETVPKAQTNGYKRRLISVVEYDRMTELGLFNENERVELLNGDIRTIMAKGTKHAAFNDLMGEIFRESLGKKVVIRNQNPIVLNNFSEPEPDIVLVKPPRATYFGKHPKPNDIFLVMEISDSTIEYDRVEKSLAYARSGIGQYLLLNIIDQTIEDYREPNYDGYEYKKTHRNGDKFNLVSFPETEVNVDDILISNAIY